MKYESTRDSSKRVCSADIILQGISVDGGLFVPSSIPKLNFNCLSSMLNLDYRERAKKLLALFLTDYTDEELSNCVDRAYSSENFSSEAIAPVKSLSDDMHILELWHGPTCAFKDMALQLLPHLMSRAITKRGIEEDVVILVATSGDTGKAALEGFKDVDGTYIVVFYPKSGVSLIQELQMTTQEGENVHVLGIEGNFDDAQTGVKDIFSDLEFNDEMIESGYSLSSANSINWGRLVPQLIYYVSAYLDMVEGGTLEWDESFDVVVPTGNFGNILAAYYAKTMGIPIDKLICASNNNNILTDFIRTGIYDSNREFHKTISPSMDILISSNLERLLYEILDRDSAELNELMNQLKSKGRYELTGDQLSRLNENFWGGYADDTETLQVIKDVYDEFDYILDPHTAVAVKVLNDYRKLTGRNKKTLVASTASPYKFIEDVLIGIGGQSLVKDMNEFEMLQVLSSLSRTEIPKPLEGLETKQILHETSLQKQDMKDELEHIFSL